jgi:bifunctional DNA-binding transcriptional regulator/antitoxin component of YhaV-PrlF toxin-antitoxin module
MKIDTNSQIAFPPSIREQLGLFPGIEIHLEVIGDTLQIRKPTPDQCSTNHSTRKEIL